MPIKNGKTCIVRQPTFHWMLNCGIDENCRQLQKTLLSFRSQIVVFMEYHTWNSIKGIDCLEDYCGFSFMIRTENTHSYFQGSSFYLQELFLPSVRTFEISHFFENSFFHQVKEKNFKTFELILSHFVLESFQKFPILIRPNSQKHQNMILKLGQLED